MNPSSIHRPAFAAVLLAVAAQAHATTYRVTPLQTSGPPVGCAALNARGDSAGTVVSNPRAEFGYDAVVVTNGVRRGYGWSHGQPAAEAYAINARRFAVGDVITDQTFGFTIGMLWQSDGSPQRLPPLAAGGTSAARGVDEAGNAVGSSTASSGYHHATLWADGRPSDLAPGSFYSAAYAINGHGQVAGATDAGPALFAGGNVVSLGTLGGGYGTAYAINEAGHVVGESSLAGDHVTHAFVFAGGAMHDLGAPAGLSSSAYGINRHDVVVGNAASGFDLPVALVWHDGVMQRLDDLLDAATGAGWTFYSANAVNDAGQICADGNRGGAVLTPLP